MENELVKYDIYGMLGGKWLQVRTYVYGNVRKWIWDWFDLFEHILWMSTQIWKDVFPEMHRHYFVGV